ncbi:right-handed parallel beta-helix repeat-containing protein [Nitrospira sp. Ecomares 2.1]
MSNYIPFLALAILVPCSPVFSASLSISNLTVASGQTYVVSTSGLQVGGTVYRDRSYTFKTVPSSVQGAAYIQTANNDKAATNSNFLSFTVNQPVSVYVAHGDRISSKPSWLSTFTDTGTNLVTSDATFSLFVRAFPAGTITLGGNASGGCCSMYSVIVKSGSGGTTTTPTTTTPTTTSSSSLSISNLAVASGQTYVVPTSGLQTGGTVYRDRSYTFKTVPSSVQGAAYIQTANTDKAATNSNFLSFRVNQPVSVYVAHGDRISSKPSWLSSFTDTGANLVTSDATFSLFVRAFPAGTITLGGNASGGCCSMYSVIVKSGSGGTTTTSTTTTPTTTTPTTTTPTTTTSSTSSSSSSSSDGDTYFVAASTGNDGNSGTQQSPFKTLERAVDVLLPGDTLYVRGGTYQGFYFSIKIPSGNSWSQPVTIKAYQQEKVVLTSPSHKTALQFRDQSHHIIVDGFIINATGGPSGIGTGHNSHHIRVINGEVMNAYHSGVTTHSGSSAFEFINLRVHDNGIVGGAFNKSHGFYLSTSSNLVKDCSIYQNTGWGVHIYSGGGNSPSNNLILNNKVYENAKGGRGVGIGIYNGSNNSAINNLIWGHNKTGIEAGSGATNSEVYNNTIYKEVYGIYADNNSGTKIVNNIVSESTSYGLLVKPNSVNSQVKNNLVFGSGSGRDILNQATTTTLSKNLEGNSFNPKFQNPGDFDFHLQSGSPAIDAGVGLSEVVKDFDNNSRPKGSSHDIGAYERP